MKCPNCKQEIEDNSVFCEYCGEKIEKEQSVDTPEVESDDTTTSQVDTKLWRKHKWVLPAGIVTGAVAVIIAIVLLVLPKNKTISEESRAEEVNLYHFCDNNGKWGYIDNSGKTIIVPQFENVIGDFSEGLASVMIGGKYGYISKDGTVVINPQYDVAGEFHDGLAPVYTNNGKWGYINSEGKVVISPQYDMVTCFSEGLAMVKINDNGSVIDTNGKSVFLPELFSLFQNGLAMVRENDKFGYIDKNGKIIISPRFANAQPFSDGLAAVKIDEKDDWGYIDTQGNVVIWPQFEVCGGFSEGLAPVGKWKRDKSSAIDGIVYEGFIDKTGKMVIHSQFECTTGYRNGMALVWNADDNNSWLNKQGLKVYEFKIKKQ